MDTDHAGSFRDVVGALSKLVVHALDISDHAFRVGAVEMESKIIGLRKISKYYLAT